MCSVDVKLNFGYQNYSQMFPKLLVCFFSSWSSPYNIYFFFLWYLTDVLQTHVHQHSEVCAELQKCLREKWFWIMCLSESRTHTGKSAGPQWSLVYAAAWMLNRCWSVLVVWCLLKKKSFKQKYQNIYLSHKYMGEYCLTQGWKTLKSVSPPPLETIWTNSYFKILEAERKEQGVLSHKPSLLFMMPVTATQTAIFSICQVLTVFVIQPWLWIRPAGGPATLHSSLRLSSEAFMLP